MRPLPLFVSLSVLTVSACLAPAAPDSELGPSPAPRGTPHILTGTVEPLDLTAPTFKLIGTVAEGGSVIGGGEPSIWAHLDGTLYLAWPGCDKGNEAQTGGLVAGNCVHGPVYRSDDNGSTWKRLLNSQNRLSDKGPAANGDNEVTVDANGTVYVSNLGAGGIQVWRSHDRGASWAYVGNVTPPRTGADRQWMSAAGPGHLIVTYMQTSPKRAVAVRTTWDEGASWNNLTVLGDNIGWLGPVQFDPTGRHAYIPYTEPEAQPSGLGEQLVGATRFKLLVARSVDGGANWSVLDTGARVQRSATGLHWSGVLMAPALDVTGDGMVVYAWSEESNEPTSTTALGSHLKFITSRDNGTTWSKPTEISRRAQKIMPWVTGGAGDRFAITYFASDINGDSDYVGVWDVQAAVVDGAAQGAYKVVEATVEARVHVGGICARGGACLLTASDRNLLDFFESDLLPDGRLVVTYPADPLEDGKSVHIRFALQDGGTRLLERVLGVKS